MEGHAGRLAEVCPTVTGPDDEHRRGPEGRDAATSRLGSKGGQPKSQTISASVVRALFVSSHSL